MVIAHQTNVCQRFLLPVLSTYSYVVKLGALILGVIEYDAMSVCGECLPEE